MSHSPVVPVEVLQHLARELYAVSAVKDRNTRNAVVSLVEDELGHPLQAPRMSTDWLDTIEILRACLAARSGLAVLVQVVELVAPDEAATVAFTTICAASGNLVPPMLTRRQKTDLLDILDGIPAPGDVSELFIAATAPLSTLPSRPDSFRALVAELEDRTSAFPLFAFLEHLAASEPGSATWIHEWVDANLSALDERRHADLLSLRAQLRGEPVVLGSRAHVLIRLQPDELSDELVTPNLWIFSNGGMADMHASSETPVHPTQLPTWLDGVLDDLNTKDSEDRRPVIEFLLSPTEMNDPVDCWDGGSGSLGSRYPVVVRPVTRPARGRERWQRQWTALGKSLERPLTDLVDWVEGPHDAAGLDRTRTSDKPCVVLALDFEDLVNPHVLELVDVGVPIMMWIRGLHSLDERHTAIKEVLSGRELSGLPDSVRAFRAKGWLADDGDIRRDYVLFWDDPSRTPPERYDLCLPHRRDGDR